MNTHHLELFYYVARHGGVSAAARRIPYGIQQPAISAQVIQLEDALGTPLFHRRPFELTPAGQEVYDFIAPFFGGVEDLAKRIRGEMEQSLRIGAPETVQRRYLPELLRKMQGRFPRLNFTLAAMGLEEIEQALLEETIDMGLSPLVGKRPPGIKEQELVRVSMALLLPKSSRIKSAEELWAMDRISEPLITGPVEGPVCRLFQGELQRRGLEWFFRLQLNSQEMIVQYVTEGFGIGLIIPEPGAPRAKGMRILPLADFPEVPYGMLWRGKLTGLQSLFLEEAEELANSFKQSP